MILGDWKNGGHIPKYDYQLNAYLPLAKEGNKNVSFQIDKHIYRNKAGVQIPSFSQVMEFVKSSYKNDTVKEGMTRGTYIHCRCAMLLEGKTIDYDSLAGDSAEPIRGAQKFIEEESILDYELIIEQPYISKWGYTGTPDFVIPDYPGKDQLWLIFLQKDGTYKKKVVKIDAGKFNEFKCAINTLNLSKKL